MTPAESGALSFCGGDRTCSGDSCRPSLPSRLSVHCQNFGESFRFDVVVTLKNVSVQFCKVVAAMFAFPWIARAEDAVRTPVLDLKV
jgi:hypothetical protein